MGKPSVDVDEAAKAAGRAARKAAQAQALTALRAMGDEAKAEWASKETDGARRYEAAKEARAASDGYAQPTEYRMKLRDPSVPRLLMWLPAAGFKAFTTFGVYGQREQRSSLRHMSLSYNVHDEQLTVSCVRVVS